MDLSSTGPSCQISQAFIHMSVVSSHLRIFQAIKCNRFFSVGLPFPWQESFDVPQILLLETYSLFFRSLYFVKICNILFPEVFCHPVSIWNNCSLSLLHNFNLQFSVVIDPLWKPYHIALKLSLFLYLLGTHLRVASKERM